MNNIVGFITFAILLVLMAVQGNPLEGFIAGCFSLAFMILAIKF